MPFSSTESLDKIRKHPTIFGDLWNDTSYTIRQNLGSVLGMDFWNRVNDDGWLAAYACVTAYDLITYGPEDPVTLPWPDVKVLLTQKSLACDGFCQVAIKLYRIARPNSPASFRILGWTQSSPVGDHSQVMIRSGVMNGAPASALLLDPTISAVGVVPFPGFFDGAKAVYYHRLGGSLHPRTSTDYGPTFPALVESALRKGAFRQTDLQYYRNERSADCPIGS
jgi:hypothetical protein